MLWKNDILIISFWKNGKYKMKFKSSYEEANLLNKLNILENDYKLLQLDNLLRALIYLIISRFYYKRE